jgi:hypothetical protein
MAHGLLCEPPSGTTTHPTRQQVAGLKNLLCGKASAVAGRIPED